MFSFRKEWAAAADAVIGLWLPRRCLLCGGAPLTVRECRLCSACRRRLRGARRAPPPPRWFGVEAGWAPFVFEDGVRDLLLHLKYRGEPMLAREAERLVKRAYRVDRTPGLGPVDAIVPVPLHPRRRRERGFNQADLLARAFGRLLAAPVRTDVLARLRDTPSQIGRDPAARRLNVRGAFAPRRRGLLQGRSIALVDDVVTTGATIAAAARALRATGVRRVVVVAVCRAGRDLGPAPGMTISGSDDTMGEDPKPCERPAGAG